ncbi:MAG: hypothetical protein RBU29_12115 [bacterium]|nr:hypothetical protein [bacterium]
MDEQELICRRVESYLGQVIGAQASHHLILRFCSHHNIKPSELEIQHLPKLGKYLKKNLEFFTGKARAHAVVEIFIQRLTQSPKL